MNAREIKESLQPGVAFAKGLIGLDEAMDSVVEHEARKGAVTALKAQETELRKWVGDLNQEVSTAGAELAALKGNLEKGLAEIDEEFVLKREELKGDLVSLMIRLADEADKARNTHNKLLRKLVKEEKTAREKTGIANDALDVARAKIA